MRKFALALAAVLASCAPSAFKTYGGPDPITDVDYTVVSLQDAGLYRTNLEWTCEGQTLVMHIVSSLDMTDAATIPVTYRFDREPPTVGEPWAAQSHVVYRAPSSFVADFMRRAHNHTGFVLRFDGGFAYDYEYKLSGLRSALRPLQCVAN